MKLSCSTHSFRMLPQLLPSMTLSSRPFRKCKFETGRRGGRVNEQEGVQIAAEL